MRVVLPLQPESAEAYRSRDTFEACRDWMQTMNRGINRARASDPTQSSQPDSSVDNGDEEGADGNGEGPDKGTETESGKGEGDA